MMSFTPNGGWLPLAMGSVTSGQVMLLGIVAVVTALSLISGARRRREGGPSPKAYARELTVRLKEQHAVKGDLSDLMLQLQEVAREVNGQLDTRFAKLERSIADADERIARLSRLTGEPHGKPVVDVTLGDTPPMESTTPESDASKSKTPFREQVRALYGQGVSIADIAHRFSRPVGEVELAVSLVKTSRSGRVSSQA